MTGPTRARIGPASALVAPAHPWRRVARTVIAAVAAIAPLLPSIVAAAGVPRTVPLVAGALAVAGGVTRVLALPAVELALRRHAPGLAAADVATEDVVTQVVEVTEPIGADGEHTIEVVVAGDAHVEPTGSELLSTDAAHATLAATAPKRRRRASTPP